MKSLEYIAGYFDGEGTVGVEKSHRARSIRVGIANTYLPALLEIQEQFGGYISVKKFTGPNSRRVYSWRVSGKAARAFLTAIVPYLDEKRPQAELALIMPERISGGHRPANDAELLAEQERIHLELRRLKHIEHCLEQGVSRPCSDIVA